MSAVPFVEVEAGVRLYYEEWGAGHPVVFVHGGAMSHEVWEQQVYAGEATRQALLAIMLQWPAYAMRLLARDLETVDLDEILPAVAVPTLVIHGVHDRKQRYGGALALARRIPGARLVPFHDSGHNPQVEEAARFTRVLVEFMEETTAAGRPAAAGLPAVPPST
ncbi:MAG: alpha/beta hydrolase [Firmicutes bacterium]|nr:alpha/beta hydrolase [Bacillota bacterium]